MEITITLTDEQKESMDSCLRGQTIEQYIVSIADRNISNMLDKQFEEKSISEKKELFASEKIKVK